MQPGGTEWSCSSCRVSYPVRAGVPLLLRDPLSVLRRWSQALAEFVEETDQNVRHLLAASVEPHLPASSRRRLLHLAQALPRQRARVVELFARAGLKPEAAPSATDAGTAPKPGSILDYYSLIFRDFVWTEVDEVGPSVRAVLDVLPPGFRLGRALVLGAGTGRLAWELARRLGDGAPVWALDINPLPLFVGAQLHRGEEVTLVELPGHPTSPETAAVETRLVAPERVEALTFLFGDGLEPPFVPGSFDTVVAPWFIDQVPANAATFLRTIADLLVPGGTYLQHGPLVYDPTRTAPAHRYSPPEMLELLGQAGFRVTRHSLKSQPYMASPISTQARRETILTLHAVREVVVKGCPEPKFLADKSGETALPRWEELREQVPPLPLLVRMVALSDGNLTARRLAERLIEEGELADDGTAVEVVLAGARVLERFRGRAGS